jgi:hypothetical protein
LTLEVDVTSIKRKRFTLDAMSKAINEFLHGVSRTFQDAALPSRRSAAAGQSFGDLFSSVSANSLDLGGAAAAGYMDEPVSPEIPDSKASPESSGARLSGAQAAPKRRSSKKKPPPDPEDGGIREI